MTNTTTPAFRCGHPKSDENTGSRFDKRDDKTYVFCKRCHRAAVRTSHARDRAKRIASGESFEPGSPEWKEWNTARRRGRGTGPPRKAEPGYSAIHLRADRVLPRECAFCGATEHLEAALKDDVDPAFLRVESRQRVQYSVRGVEQEDYLRLCVSCHRNYDKSWTNAVKTKLRTALERRRYRGKPFTKEVIDSVIEDNWNTLLQFPVAEGKRGGGERVEMAIIFATIQTNANEKGATR